MSCVTTMLVTGLCDRVLRISSLMTSLMIGSSPVVGSSYKMTSGAIASARASPTRFRMPPDNSAGFLLMMDSGKPTSESRFTTVFCTSEGVRILCCLRGNAMFWATVMLSNSAAPWKTKPNRIRSWVICFSLRSSKFCPSNVMEPDVGRIRPMIVFIKTVFPHPLSPMIARVSPRDTDKVMFRRTVCAPNRMVKF